MVVVNLIGGLGNQMFQYATARAIALERNQKLYINAKVFEKYTLHSYGLNHFNIKATAYNEPAKWIKKITNKLRLNSYYKETSFRYNSALFDNATKNLFLNGYFQSEIYFKKYRSIITNDFKIVSPLKPKTQSFLHNISQENSVSIHIRRGDFIEHEVHNTSKEAYYKKAMDFIESKIDKPTYYLFSDDMNWVKSNFKTNYNTIYVDFNDAKTAYEDLILMSHCKHNIIANSSFSWWASWLNENTNKIVIAPQQWFNGDKYDYTDVIPNSWIKL